MTPSDFLFSVFWMIVVITSPFFFKSQTKSAIISTPDKPLGLKFATPSMKWDNTDSCSSSCWWISSILHTAWDSKIISAIITRLSWPPLDYWETSILFSRQVFLSSFPSDSLFTFLLSRWFPFEVFQCPPTSENLVQHKSVLIKKR